MSKQSSLGHYPAAPLHKLQDLLNLSKLAAINLGLGVLFWGAMSFVVVGVRTTVGKDSCTLMGTSYHHVTLEDCTEIEKRLERGESLAQIARV